MGGVVGFFEVCTVGHNFAAMCICPSLILKAVTEWAIFTIMLESNKQLKSSFTRSWGFSIFRNGISLLSE